VATDTQKQTCYILAKQNPVTPPELFAAIVSSHFVTTYPHIHAAHVKVVQHRWARLPVDGKPHPHSFFRDGEETREVEAVARDNGGGIVLKSIINKLLVLKSTGSAFYGFHRDEFTQLPEVWDRILSTEIMCGYTWKTFPTVEDVKRFAPKFDAAWEGVREITTSTFAKDNSASVQNTMYKMCDQILASVPAVEKVDYSLPNKHYFEIGKSFFPFDLPEQLTDLRRTDLSWHKGLKNTGKDAEVYAPQSNPNGLIECTVSRKGAAAKL
jgi:urate oxidase